VKEGQRSGNQADEDKSQEAKKEAIPCIVQRMLFVPCPHSTLIICKFPSLKNYFQSNAMEIDQTTTPLPRPWPVITGKKV
jgi:hypothetical protein